MCWQRGLGRSNPGIKVQIGAFPFVVSLSNNLRRQHFCDDSIFGGRTAMTDSAGDTNARAKHAREKKPHRVRNGIILGVVALLVIVAGTAAFYTLNLARTFDNKRVVAEEVFPEDSLRPPAPKPESPSYGSQNILLLGADVRGKISSDIDEVGGGRADTIMVMHIPADRENVQVMSIMRDNWVPIPGRGHAKINAALAFGRIPLMVATVEDFIGARIDHVAVIDFDGFKGLTDALGGVTVNSTKAFKADGYTFQEGPQKLDGDAALAFVRERKSFADGDYQRARNQQIFMKAVVDRFLSKDVLTSPGKISDSVSTFAPYLTVDEGLNSGYLGGLAWEMRDIRSSDIRFFTSPTLGTGWAEKQSIVKPDWDRIDEIREHFQNDTLHEYEPGAY